MGSITKLKEIGSGCIKIGAQCIGTVLECVERGALTLGWYDTAAFFHEGVDACARSRDKWKDRQDRYYAENIIGPIEKPDDYKHEKKIRDIERKCIENLDDILKNDSLEDTLRNQTPSERLDFIDQVANIASNAFGVKTNEIQYYHGGETSFGVYNREDNRIYLNEAYVTCDNIYLVKEQLFTIFHETMHAAQWNAVKNLVLEGDDSGYSKELLLEWAENFKNYIRPDVDMEGYRNQPLEREAFGFEWRLKNYYSL